MQRHVLVRFAPSAILLLACLETGRADSPDFIKGLAQFEKLGVPSVTNAVYVRLECYGYRTESPLPYHYETGGNAWMLQETRDKSGRPAKGTFAVNGAEVVEVFNRRLGKEAEDEQAEAGSASDSSARAARLYGEWKRADLQNDIKMVFRFLKSLERERFPHIYLDSETRSGLFLFALQLHQRGDRENAGEILKKLFERVEIGDVIRDALDRLANAQYDALYSRFRTGHDWKTYRDGIQDLLTKYPHGWRCAPGVRLLLERVQKRIAQPVPPPAATNKFTEAEINLAAGLIGLRTTYAEPGYDRYRNRRDEILWLLPSTWKEEIPPKGNADLEIRAQGWEAVPFLLALTRDEALTEADTYQVRQQGDYYRYLLSPNAEQDPEALFAVLRRPATRGEVVNRILLDILPTRISTENGNRRPDYEIQEFYEQHKNAADEELAALYLHGDAGDGSTPALEFLMQAATTKRVPVLEKYLLVGFSGCWHGLALWREDAYADHRATYLTKYAALRGAEVRPVIQDFIKKLEEGAANLERPDDELYRTPKEKEEHDAQIRTELRRLAGDLSLLPYGKTVDELLDRAQSQGKETAGSERAMLFARFESMPADDVIGILLRKAAASDVPTNRFAVGKLLEDVAFNRRMKGARQKALARNSLDRTHHIDAWKSLVRDDRKAGDPEVAVADLFLCLNEDLFGSVREEEERLGRFSFRPRRDNSLLGESGNVARALIADYGPRGRELVRHRVLARLDGAPEDQLPRYPQDQQLSADEVSSTKRKLAAVTSRQQAVELVESLSIYALAALPDILRHDAELNARLTALASTVTRVSVRDDEQFGNRMKKWEGGIVSPDLVQELLDHCTSRSKAQRPVACLLVRKENFGGCEILVRPATDEEASKADRYGSRLETNGVVGLTGLVCAPGVYGAVRWRTAPPPAETNWTSFLTSDPDLQEEFRQAVQNLCSPRPEACSTAFARFLTKGRTP